MNKEIVEMFDLAGHVAVVTGGARHLGFDAAGILAAAGCDVAITSRNLARSQESAEKLRQKYSRDVLPIEMDQTCYTDVSEAACRVRDWKGRIDILVNNAGGSANHGAMRLFDRKAQDIDELVRVNLTGLIYCCREFGSLMAERRSGSIINIASIAGLVGRDRRMYDRAGMKGQPVDYAAAKAGVIGLTRDLAASLGPMGIRVNAVSPGGFARELCPEFVEYYSDRTPLGRMGKDGVDIKGAILFLACPAADYVTGHNLVVDGGFSIWQ
ncbi:MAG: SDR family oxidoreductase [Acidobacteria bacterium]|nr:SDR family oxidoreductase [Acidobacteriota bacterium]